MTTTGTDGEKGTATTNTTLSMPSNYCTNSLTTAASAWSDTLSKVTYNQTVSGTYGDVCGTPTYTFSVTG